METISVTKPIPGNTIGLVSGSRVIIHTSKDTSVVQLEDIKSINLTKKRWFGMNLFFMVLAAAVTVILLNNLHLAAFQKQAFGVLILTALVMGVFYKSYFYQISIHLKDHKLLMVRKGVCHKKHVKNFYYSLRKNLRKEHIDFD